MAKKKSGSNTARAAGKQGGKGVPFKKDDPRIWKGGQKNKAAVAFHKQLRELIVKEGEKKAKGKGEKGDIVNLKKVEWLVISVWQKAIAGESWAVQFIAERVEGRVVQPVEGPLSISYQFSEKFMPKMENEKK